jgi:hypothetical protein
VTAVLLGSVACELLSSGGFYFFSGRFAEPGFAEFVTREARYFPMYLQSMLFYIGIATAVHALFGLLQGAADNHKTTSV